MKKRVIASFALLLAACGDETTINQTGMEVADSVENLSECTANNEGVQAIVKGERSIRVCMDGEWIETAESVTDTLIIAGDTIYMQGGKDTVYVNSSDFSCKTEELADKSGLKIICNGDSIGVVLNGAKGDKGEDGQNGTKGEDGAKGDSGAGCSIKAKTDTTVTVACGDSAMVIQLGHAADGDTMTIKLDSLIGYTQKGPFLKGSSVYLYELNGSLNQTNGNFTSVIADDDGRYRFRTRGLKYPYAMIVVDGYYRNEVTGVTSDAPIRLRAITDVSSRVTGSANVNLLTHLEFDRVNSLATGPGKLKLKEAKHKAQAEILDAFLVDTNLVKNVQSEDMNVFGKSDADAALLAISVLLQGDGKAADLSVRLTELADDLVDGKWDGNNSEALRVELADWAAVADGNGRLGDFRSKVGSWKLSDTVPVFEKFVRNFYSRETKLGKCGSEDIPVGTLMNVKNPKSKYFAEKYADTTSRVRFICADADSARWRVATELEKDTVGLGHEFENGDIARGAVNKELVYVYDDGWRHGTALDSTVGKGCRRDLKDTIVHAADSGWYKCIGDSAMTFTRNGLDESAWKGAWRRASTLEIDTNGLGHEYQEGDVHYGQINTDLVYVYENGNWVAGKAMDVSVGTGCVATLEGKVIVGKSDGEYYICKLAYANGSAVPVDRSWEPAPNVVKDTSGWGAIGGWTEGQVRNGNVNKEQPYVFQDGAWRVGTILDSLLRQGCIADGDTSIRRSNNRYYVCTIENVAGVYTSRTWVVAPDIYNDTKEYRTGCKRFGEYGYGNILTGITNTTKSYVCENGQFRRATDSEVGADRACVGYIYDHIYKINGSFRKCGTNGSWTTVGDTAKGQVFDLAGRSYKTLVLGEQLWMAENLRYETDNSYYGSYYNSSYYSWTAAMNACPAGWHVPTLDEWSSLIDYAGGTKYGTGALNIQSTDYGGSDKYGFSLKKVGFWENDKRVYESQVCDYWTSTEYDSSRAYFARFFDSYSTTSVGLGQTYYSGKNSSNWRPVRCIQDN